MFLKLLLLLPTLTILLSNAIYSQGCSDAGVCTMNSFKPHESDTVTGINNQVRIAASYGIADNSISVISSYLEYNRKLSDRLSLDAKLTFLSQSGNDITSSGLSDIFLTGNYIVDQDISLTLGAKLPLGKADKNEDGLPLPMDYQSSLGTFDLIAGIGFRIDPLQFVLAFQQPLSQNKNAFFPGVYPVDSPLMEFQGTNGFIRSGDIMLRVSYPFELTGNINMALSVLPVYHLVNDKFTDVIGAEMEIEGSGGLTFNTNVIVDYELGEASILQLNLAAPLLVRDARPDGLTRSFVAALEYRVGF